MPLITLQNISLSFGSPPLLDGIDLTMERGERICLIGRNGEGKSTLMKLIAGELMPDEGRINKGGETGVARLTQEIPGNGSGTVFELVADGLGKSAELLKRYHAACLKLAGGSDETTLKKLSAIQHEMESAGGWQLDRQVEQVISRMGLEP
ncbi:MAG TPA: ATP-binding cassette domain-containing protein, partial [Chromatiaceae bacterium]|nr:ATP-binding cassette domain-containing protein [Chromatiaceae bacterium]